MDWKLADYFGKPVVEKSETMRLDRPCRDGDRLSLHGGRRGASLPIGRQDSACRWIPAARPTPRRDDRVERLDQAGIPAESGRPAGSAVARAHRPEVRGTRAGGGACCSTAAAGSGPRWPGGGRRRRRRPDLKYSPVYVPCNDWWPPKGQYGSWFRKKFRVPAWLRGEAFQLEVGRAYREGTLFLNGKRLDGVCPGVLAFPAGCHRTAEARRRERIGGPCARRRGPGERGLRRSLQSRRLDRERRPPGLSPRRMRTALAPGRVWLRALPAVRVRQTLVVPDVEAINSSSSAAWRTCESTPCSVDLRYAVSQEGKPVPDAVIPAQSVTLNRAKRRKSRSWEAARACGLTRPPSRS